MAGGSVARSSSPGRTKCSPGPWPVERVGNRPGWILILAGAAVAFGLALRVAWPTRLPDGPWIDEVSALRAARTLVSAPPVNPFGTSPLLPPEAGFAGAYESNLYLLLTGLVDRLAGGGMASVRAVSIGCSVLFFLASLLLGAELFGIRSRPFAFSAVLLASSAWCLRLGRWGWFNLWTAALMTAALALALRAARTSAKAPAFAAGLLLGLAQYGYLSSRAGLAFAFGTVVVLLVFHHRKGASCAALPVALAVFGTALLVALPLFLHQVRSADRSTERLRELAPAGGARALPGAVLRNGAGLAGLFFGAGDPNPRHGEPGRPLLPLPVALSVVTGVSAALRAGGGARATALAGFVMLAPNLATKGGPEAVNSFRVLAAAAPLLVLAGLAWDRFASALERRSPTLGAIAAPGLLVGLGFLEASAFLRWGQSSRTDALFGGPERRLADELVELGAGARAEVHFSRRAFDEGTAIVEVLLASPSSSARGVRVEVPGLTGPQPRLATVPRTDVLFVDLETAPGGRLDDSLGARVVTRIPAAGGRPALHVLRIPEDRARSLAEETLRRFSPRRPGTEGEVVVLEDGLWRVDYEAAGSSGTEFVRLLPGRHRTTDLLPEGGRLRRLTGADGFPRRGGDVP